MSECRALTNFVGNAVATIVVSRWQGQLDVERLREALAAPAAAGRRADQAAEFNHPSDRG
jgi:aerobic C4-dicarboxylate transport protein